MESIDKIPLLIVVKETMLFNSIISYLKNEKIYHKGIDQAKNEQEAIEKTRKLVNAIEKKDLVVILMDTHIVKGMDGAEATRQIKNEFKNEVKILALSHCEESQYIRKMVDLGASGYLVKDDLVMHKKTLISAIKAVLEGNTIFSVRAAESLFDIQEDKIDHTLIKQDERLTKSEIEVLQLSAKGLTAKAIAKERRVEIKTIYKQRETARGKLGVTNTTQAINKARELGYFK